MGKVIVGKGDRRERSSGRAIGGKSVRREGRPSAGRDAA
ncbi:hypothetical protein BN2537_4921 [Streptomyces venezuelae]|nr:hypothetical protein BN2537_4921 [Streptomyces venezuelae]